jgi:hypothetical protein
MRHHPELFDQIHSDLRERTVNGLFRASTEHLHLGVDTVHAAITLFDQVLAVVPFDYSGLVSWREKLPDSFYLEESSVRCLAW